MDESRPPELTHDNLREKNLRAAITVRVFGVPVSDRPGEYVTIAWCGIGLDGLEHRESSERIWHLPKRDILATGEVDGFDVDGRRVQWYDLRKDSTAVEENYTPVSLIHLARLRLGGRFGNWGGLHDIPVTLEPTSTTIPSSPPVTLDP